MRDTRVDAVPLHPGADSGAAGYSSTMLQHCACCSIVHAAACTMLQKTVHVHNAPFFCACMQCAKNDAYAMHMQHACTCAAACSAGAPALHAALRKCDAACSVCACTHGAREGFPIGRKKEREAPLLPSILSFSPSLHTHTDTREIIQLFRARMSRFSQ